MAFTPGESGPFLLRAQMRPGVSGRTEGVQEPPKSAHEYPALFRCHVLHKVHASAGRRVCLPAFLKSLGWNHGDSEGWALGCHSHSWEKGSLVLVRALAFWALRESSRWVAGTLGSQGTGSKGPP